MKQPTDKLRTNTLGMLAAVLGFGVVAILATITFAAQDLLWFVSGFAERPARIVVYAAGQRHEFTEGQPGFDLLAEGVIASLSGGVARQSGIGFSDESLRDAYTLYVTVEAFFAQPVKLHAGFNTGWPTQMLFPLTGRHSELSVVLLGQDGRYQSNPPALKRLEPLRDAVAGLGLYRE
jgi:hypothetical protein